LNLRGRKWKEAGEDCIMRSFITILYASPDIIRMIWSKRTRVGHAERMGEIRNEYKILAGKLEGKRPLGRLSSRGEDNIRIDVREIG